MYKKIQNKTVARNVSRVNKQDNIYSREKKKKGEDRGKKGLCAKGHFTEHDHLYYIRFKYTDEQIKDVKEQGRDNKFDTIYSICLRFGITQEELAKENGVKVEDLHVTGRRTLKIPSTEKKKDPPKKIVIPPRPKNIPEQVIPQIWVDPNERVPKEIRDCGDIGCTTTEYIKKIYAENFGEITEDHVRLMIEEEKKYINRVIGPQLERFNEGEDITRWRVPIPAPIPGAQGKLPFVERRDRRFEQQRAIGEEARKRVLNYLIESDPGSFWHSDKNKIIQSDYAK